MDEKMDLVSDLLCQIVKRVPGVGRTQLVKLLYLADAASRSFLGKPITDLEYIWYNHGPFDSRIYNRLSKLSQSGNIQENRVKYSSMDGYQYAIGREPDHSALDKHQAAIVEYIIREFGQLRLRALLDYTNKTAPMKKAIADKAKGQPLDMGVLEDRTQEYNSVQISLSQLDRGEGIPLSSLYKRKKTG